jgi:hypothetical protein
MNFIKRFLVARKTVLSLLVAVIAAVVLAYSIPQQLASSPAEISVWQELHPIPAKIAGLFQLHRVFTSWWFVVILLLLLLSLLFSSNEQIVRALKKTTILRCNISDREFLLACSVKQFSQTVKKLGYFKIGPTEPLCRFVKNPWGYWGNAFLHVGFVFIIVASLFVVLTQKRGLINLHEGEVFPAGGQWLSEERGALVGNFFLPDAVRLNKVTPEFWENGDQKQLTTSVVFMGPGAVEIDELLIINKIVYHRGVRVYQSRFFGEVFFLSLLNDNGERVGLRLDLEHPSRIDTPSYGAFRFDDLPFLLKAKYFVDADMQSMNSENPLLVLRLFDGDQLLGELPLKIGETGGIGPYQAHLVDVKRWAGLFFVDITGMPIIFFAFFVIIAGSSLTYFFPPREFLVREDGERLYLTWKPSRFACFYRDELENIIRQFGGQRDE